MASGTVAALAQWLGASALSHTIQTHAWVIPTLQTVHILCVALVFSSVILVDLRALRLLQRDASLEEVARRFLPAVLPLVLVLLATGILLIIGEPKRSLLNETFYLKLALIGLSLVLTAALRRAFSRGFLEEGARWQRAGQLVAGLSMLAWCGVLFAGRWIAYTQVDG